MNITEAIKSQFDLRVFEESIPRIIKVLDVVDEDQIWFRPNDNANSIGHLILHLCGNVTQWIGSGIGNLKDERVRDEEFETTDKISKEVLTEKLWRLKDVTEPALSKISSAEDLMRKCRVQGFEETVLSVIIHVIEHFSYHTGQIAIIAKYLKDVDLGFYDGFDLNAKG